MGNAVDSFFKLTERKSNVRTELFAGCATFLTMAYIIVVNPSILADPALGNGAMPYQGVLFATVLVASFSSILMGLYANLPVALAPGMGINAFFAYTLVGSMGVSWQTALAAVFFSGIVFLVLSLTPIRSMIVRAIPKALKFSIAAGIGLFLAFIGLKNVGFITHNPGTLVGFGGMNILTVLFFIGLVITSALVVKKVRAALVIGIAATSLITLCASLLGTHFGWLAEPLVNIPSSIVSLPSFETVGTLDIKGALKVSMIIPIFTFLFTDMFDGISTLIGVCQVAGLTDEDGNPMNMKKGLIVDAISTTLSGLVGTSSGTSFVESAAGVEEGGRTGLTAIVAGLLFLPFMFFGPLLSFIPNVATAPVLVIVGLFMLSPIVNIDWRNFEDAIPAFLAMFLIPLTYSITQGIAWGFLSYTIIKLFVGKGKDVHPMLYIIDVFAVLALILV